MTEELSSQIERFEPRTQRVLALSAALSEIPGITVPAAKTDFEALQKSYNLCKEFAEQSGLRTIEMPADEAHPYPYLIVAFDENDPSGPSPSSPSGNLRADVALVGHIDVVGAQKPEQFTPRIEGDMLIGRGVADMKTVVATQLVWMAEQQAKPGPHPPIVLMISSTEENGSTQPNGTQHAIAYLRDHLGAKIELAIVGERTGEMETMGKVPVGPICDANRGWRWYRAQGSDILTGSEGLTLVSMHVRSGREQTAFNNENIGSDRTRQQQNWRSGFVNSFASIGPDANLDKFQGGTLIELEIPGEAKHAASISAADPTVLEKFARMFDDLEKAVGKGNIAVESVRVGEDGNYNTVTGGGKMRLVVSDENLNATTVRAISIIEETFQGINISYGTFDPLAVEARSAVFGLDIREIPEHTDDVNHWIDDTRDRLNGLGFEFQNVNEGDGWVCPPANPRLLALQSAYEGVIGSPSPALGKLHGNDGRFFDGNAVVFGQTGVSPHGPNEAHYIPSIANYLEILDNFAARITI